ncbi:hypothetical protein NDK47_05475 [Brevibacillus ruminantium]|uniref:Lipoprotein n=1 Tax=Brevibacillus ruminantium TaxID=2950604 RepID=A0ABY4WHX4_9BACL|nr:hypothetical protein [Brevibacillus ruminantium]USG66748.1 hypothetical protein NDK47_05475 [Brevibacillus ruminantium]
MNKNGAYTLFALVGLCLTLYGCSMTSIEAAGADGEKQALLEEIAQLKDKEVGLQNMIKQYVEETNFILDEVSPLLPVFSFKTEEEKIILERAKSWLQATDKQRKPDAPPLDKNLVILSLNANGVGDNDMYIIDVIFYEKQDPDEIGKSEWPRPIGKSFIGYGQIRLKQKQGNWEVAEFIDKF